jgi:hypothetical protein
MGTAKAGVDWCEYCSVYPRNPCQSKGEAVECPNASAQMKEHYRSLTGYLDELAEYRRRYGSLK